MSEPLDLCLGDLLDLREALAFRIEAKPVASRAQLACLRKLLGRLYEEIERRERQSAAPGEAPPPACQGAE